MRTLWEYDDIKGGKPVHNNVYDAAFLVYNVDKENYLLIDLKTGYVIVDDLDRYQMLEKLNEYDYKLGTA